MWKKKLSGFLLGRNSPPHIECFMCLKRTSGSIKRTDAALGPPALFQLDFFTSPDSVTEVPKTSSAHAQCHACTHTPQ